MSQNKHELLRQAVAFSILVFALFLAGAATYYPTVDVMSQQSESVELPVLMYHHLTEHEKYVGEYTLHVSRFESDLKYLRDNGYTAVTSEQLADYINGRTELPEKPIFITFDDGFRSFLVYAVPLLEKYDMHAIVNVVGEYTDKATKAKDDNVIYSYLDWDDVKQIAESKYAEIGNHTYAMHRLKERKGCDIMKGESSGNYCEAIKKDIGEYQKQLKFNTGVAPQVFAYPFGCFCERSVPVLEGLGFDILLCSEQRMNTLHKGQGKTVILGRFNMTPENDAGQVLMKQKQKVLSQLQ